MPISFSVDIRPMYTVVFRSTFMWMFQYPFTVPVSTGKYYSAELSAFSQASSRSAGEEVRSPLWKRKVYYCVK